MTELSVHRSLVKNFFYKSSSFGNLCFMSPRSLITNTITKSSLIWSLYSYTSRLQNLAKSSLKFILPRILPRLNAFTNCDMKLNGLRLWYLVDLRKSITMMVVYLIRPLDVELDITFDNHKFYTYSSQMLNLRFSSLFL